MITFQGTKLVSTAYFVVAAVQAINLHPMVISLFQAHGLEVSVIQQTQNMNLMLIIEQLSHGPINHRALDAHQTNDF